MILKRNSYIIVILLAIITSLLAVKGEWIDGGFPYTNIADSIIVESKGHLVFDPFPSNVSRNSLNLVANLRSYKLLVVLLPVFLGQVTGIPIPEWIFFPLAGVFIPLLGYLIVRRILFSEAYAFVYGAYLAFESQSLLRNYNTNIQGYGFIFFFTILFILAKELGSKTSPHRSSYILLMTFFVAVLLSYYSTEFYSVTFIAILVILFYLRKNCYAYSVTKNLFAVFLIFMLSFEKLVYSYLRIIVQGKSKSIFDPIWAFISNVLKVFTGEIQKYAEPTKISTPGSLLYLNALLMFLLFLPIASSLFHSSKKNRRLEFIKNGQLRTLFSTSVIVTGILDVLFYGVLEGDIDLKFFYMFFPISALIIVFQKSNRNLPKARKKKFGSLYLIGLLSIVILRFCIYSIGPYSILSHRYTSDLSQFQTIISISGPTKVYLSDNVACGKLILASASIGVYEFTFIYQYSSWRSTQFLYSANMRDLKALNSSTDYQLKYIVISSYSLSQWFPAQGWTSYPPLSNYSNVINVPRLNVVYEGLDTKLLVFQNP